MMMSLYNDIELQYDCRQERPCTISDSFKELCLFVCFLALRPKSTAMVIVGRSVHLTTLFPGQA